MKSSRMVRLLITLGIASLALGVAQIAPEQLAMEWQARINAGDAAAVAALYTEDSTMRHADAMVSTGRAEIEAWAQGAIEAGFSFAVIPSSYEMVSDTVAISQGAWSATNAEGQVVAAGEYIAVDIMVNSEWKIHRMFSAPMPLVVE